MFIIGLLIDDLNRLIFIKVHIHILTEISDLNLLPI